MLQPKKPVKKYVPTAKEKKNLDDASKNINMRPPFTPEERKKMPKVGNMGSAKSGASLKAQSGTTVNPVRQQANWKKEMDLKKKELYSKTSKPKAKDGKSFPDLNKDGKITKADVLKGRGVIAKKGASVKKAQYGRAIMGTVGGMMNDMQQLKKEKMDRKKAETPPSPPTSKRPDSNMSTPYPTSGVNPATLAKSGKTMKKVKAKSGASVKKCKYGCK